MWPVQIRFYLITSLFMGIKLIFDNFLDSYLIRYANDFQAH